MEIKLETLKFYDLCINEENGNMELRLDGVVKEIFKYINLIDLVYVKVFEVWSGFENSKRIEVRSATSIFSETCVKVDGHWKCQDGNIIIPCTHHLCVLTREKAIAELCIITMRGLATKASRRWNNKAMQVVKKNNNYQYCPPKYTHTYSASVIREKERYMWDFSNPSEIESSETLNYLITIKDYISMNWDSIVYHSVDN